MAEMHSSHDRLEARLDRLSARVDALYSLLEDRGPLAEPADGARGDAPFDELLQVEDTPFARETRTRPPRRRSVSRLRVGSGSGV